MSRESLENNHHKPLANAFVPSVPRERPQLPMDTLAHEMISHCQICKYTYKDPVMQIYGKRCNLTVLDLWFDKLDNIFHLKEKLGRIRCCMIQNQRKGFYVMNKGALNEYFYDSYEGWYIQSFYHGFKYNYTSEASSKYRQCEAGVELNTQSYQRVMEQLKR